MELCRKKKVRVSLEKTERERERLVSVSTERVKVDSLPAALKKESFVFLRAGKRRSAALFETVRGARACTK